MALKQTFMDYVQIQILLWGEIIITVAENAVENQRSEAAGVFCFLLNEAETQQHFPSPEQIKFT